MSDGAALSSITFGQGSSGQVNIRNRDTTVRGDNPAGLYSNISVLTYGTGSAKTLTLDTARLQLLDGGVVAGTSFFIGNGGDIRVNATESIQISDCSRLNQITSRKVVVDSRSQPSNCNGWRFGGWGQYQY